MRGCRQVGVLLALLVGCSASAPPAKAERLEQLLLGPEVRVRPSEGLVEQPRYELSLPHGFSSAHADLLARVGVVISPSGDALAFPLTLGMRYVPFDFLLRPLLGMDLGGYFSQARGEQAQGAPSGLAWTWSVRGLAGGELRMGNRVAVRLFFDASWAQTPGALVTREVVFSGLGAGAEVVFRWTPPRWKLVDMLLRGDNAPKGW